MKRAHLHFPVASKLTLRQDADVVGEARAVPQQLAVLHRLFERLKALGLAVALNLKDILQLTLEKDARVRVRRVGGAAHHAPNAVPFSTYLQVILAVGRGVRVLDVARNELEHVRAALERADVRVELLVVNVNRVIGMVVQVRL